MPFNPLKVGGWAFGELLTSAQMDQVNTDFPYALDGRDGGSYAPTSPIVIGGSGLGVSTLAVTGSAAVANLTATGTTTTAAINASGVVTATLGVRAPQRMITVSPAAGTTNFGPQNWDIVMTKTAVPAGTNWKLDNTGTMVGETLLIANLDATGAQPILLKDSSGATIQSIIYATGQPFVFMAIFLGGTAWQLIPLTYHP